MPGLDGLELDGHLLAVGDVDAQVDVAEASAADLADEAILAADDELGPASQRSRRCSRHHVVGLEANWGQTAEGRLVEEKRTSWLRSNPSNLKGARSSLGNCFGSTAG